jgi:hypothetical protein
MAKSRGTAYERRLERNRVRRQSQRHTEWLKSAKVGFGLTVLGGWCLEILWSDGLFSGLVVSCGRQSCISAPPGV